MAPVAANNAMTTRLARTVDLERRDFAVIDIECDLHRPAAYLAVFDVLLRSCGYIEQDCD